MSHVILGPSERMLLKFQRKHLIETDPSSSESDNHKNDTIKMLNSESGLLRLQTVIRINRILKFFYLQKPLEVVDRNLISGIFVRRPQAAQENEAMQKQYSVFGVDIYQRQSSTRSINFGSRVPPSKLALAQHKLRDSYRTSSRNAHSSQNSNFYQMAFKDDQNTS